MAVEPSACRLRSPGDSRKRLGLDDVVVHWTLTPQSSRLRRSLLASLDDYAACARPELVAASANSLVRAHPRTALDEARLPKRVRMLLPLVDGVCESGTEFVFWSRLARLHPRIRRQVWVAGVGRVDFLVGDRLVVEIDGFEHHGDRERFESDRHRDALLGADGYRILRYSHRQVFERWSTVEAALFAALARGDHL